MKERIITTFDHKIKKYLREILDYFLEIENDESKNILIYKSYSRKYTPVGSRSNTTYYDDIFLIRISIDEYDDIAGLVTSFIDLRRQYISDKEIKWVKDNFGEISSHEFNPDILQKKFKAVNIFYKYLDFKEHAKKGIFLSPYLINFFDHCISLEDFSNYDFAEYFREQKKELSKIEQKERLLRIREQKDEIINFYGSLSPEKSDQKEFSEDLKFLNLMINNLGHEIINPDQRKLVENEILITGKVYYLDQVKDLFLSQEEFFDYYQSEYLLLPLKKTRIGISYDKFDIEITEEKWDDSFTPFENLLNNNFFESIPSEIIISSDFIILISSFMDLPNFDNFKDTGHAEYICYGEYPYWTDFDDINLMNELDSFYSYELFIGIIEKLQLFDLNTKEFLKKYKDGFSNTSFFRNDVDILNYFKKEYQNILDDENHKLEVFKGVKLPKKICDLFVKCMIEIIDLKINEYSGTLFNYISPLSLKKENETEFDHRLDWDESEEFILELFSFLIKQNVFIIDEKEYGKGNEKNLSIRIASNFFKGLKSEPDHNSFDIKINEGSFQLFYNTFWLLWKNLKSKMGNIKQEKIANILYEKIVELQEIEKSKKVETIISNLAVTTQKKKDLNEYFKKIFQDHFPQLSEYFKPCK